MVQSHVADHVPRISLHSSTFYCLLSLTKHCRGWMWLDVLVCHIDRWKGSIWNTCLCQALSSSIVFWNQTPVIFWHKFIVTALISIILPKENMYWLLDCTKSVLVAVTSWDHYHRYGILGFNVPLGTVQVISETGTITVATANSYQFILIETLHI